MAQRSEEDESFPTYNHTKQFMSEKFQHKKSLGQHFLNSDIVPRWMCDAGNVQAGETILEIGPGTGALTKELLERGAQVKAIEADDRAIEALQDTFAAEIKSGQLRVEKGDMRKLDGEGVAKIFDLRDHQYKLIANIPYYLSGLLFRTFLETPVQPSTIVFLVQKEVAERITRDPKESLLSLSVKVFGDPSYIRTVGRGHFTPPPTIDSAIIAINHISRADLSSDEIAMFFKLIHAGFSQRRKQLQGLLKPLVPNRVLIPLLHKHNLPASVRAEDIPLPVWIDLTKEQHRGVMQEREE